MSIERNKPYLLFSLLLTRHGETKPCNKSWRIKRREKIENPLASSNVKRPLQKIIIKRDFCHFDLIERDLIESKQTAASK